MPLTRRMGTKTKFHDRIDAGRLLAAELRQHVGANTVVLGLPRGGMAVAAEVAKTLSSPLDVLVVRKIGLPNEPEVAMGAVGEGGACIRNDETIAHAGVTDDQFFAVELHELGEIERQVRRYRSARPLTPLTGKTALIVDDGIATGSTVLVAIAVARELQAARVVVATPVSSRQAADAISAEVDDFIALEVPPRMTAVGQWYDDFGPTSEQEVERLLGEAADRTSLRHEDRLTSGPDTGALLQGDVWIAAGPIHLTGHLFIPADPVGVVAFAHGPGSSRHSPRNRFVAGVLNDHAIATLLIDLLTEEEAVDGGRIVDIDLLASRLDAATQWLRSNSATASLRVGFFGASTGAAAALRAAARPDADITAIVTRGGHLDLVGPVIDLIDTPTLMLVGEYDYVVLAHNREAVSHLGEHKLVVVQGASEMFEEGGALETVAQDAQIWFTEYFACR